MARLIKADDIRKRIQTLIDDRGGPLSSEFTAGLYTAMLEISDCDTVAFIDDKDGHVSKAWTFTKERS